jgi:hypothetical protein
VDLCARQFVSENECPFTEVTSDDEDIVPEAPANTNTGYLENRLNEDNFFIRNINWYKIQKIKKKGQLVRK